MSEAKPRALAIYRRGPTWVDGMALQDEPNLLDHGRFLARLERSGQAVTAGPAHRLAEVPDSDPIGFASFPVDVEAVRELLLDDPGLTSGLLVCDVFPWHVTDA